ncbi:hypothetical protein MA884_27620, partial [Pseudomonas sp. Q11]|nr:hypothetical protein [Pseudomonas sp. Q11]
MDNDDTDDIKKGEAAGISEGNNGVSVEKANDVSAVSSVAPTNGVLAEVILDATYEYGVMASVKLEYEVVDQRINIQAKEYRSKSSGFPRCVLYMIGDNGVQHRVSADPAIQDDQWHVYRLSYSQDASGYETTISLVGFYWFQGDIWFDYWGRHSVRLRVRPPVINAPKSGEDVGGWPVFSGAGEIGAQIQIYRSHSGELVPHHVSYVIWPGIWSLYLFKQLTPGTHQFTAKETLDGMTSDWAPNISVNVILRNPPEITGPAAGSVQDRTFTVTGNKGHSGAIVQVFRDTQDEMLGQTNTLTGASWSCSVTAPVGNISLAALQVVSGKPPSDRSTPRAFRIRPPKLTAVTVTTPTDTSVKFEGSGHTGATVQITVVSGPNVTAPAPAPVNGGSWNTTATNWPFGSYSLQAIQRFPDGDNGWIDSQLYIFPVNLILPDPTDITYTPVYLPVFSGKGFNGATVKILNPDDSPAASERIVSGGVWSSPASTEWGPTFKRKVKVRQFKDGQQSPTWQEIEVTIPPLAPVMNVPVENGLSPDLNGTCWPDAVLTLTFSDSATEHPVENNNGTWHFRRT